MTREEAIGFLIKDKEQRGDCYISEALDMAIEALKQKPCDDAISRQAVLNKAFEIKTGKYTSAMVVYAHDIRTLTPVNPQPKIG